MYQTPLNHLYNPGHTACAGCGQSIAARHVIDALGPKTIIANATGCLEVFTTRYPQSSWKVPWVHSLFENAAAMASGVYAALKHLGKDKEINILAQGGDGGTFDIGFGLISGMWERGDNILYVCYDNEAYMNTGNQYSQATPVGAATTTTPNTKTQGNQAKKKDLPAIAMAHGLSYVATATIGFPLDLVAKVKKAITFNGPKYIQVLVPCVPGWGYNSELTMILGRLAQQSGFYPVFEAEKGKITSVMKVGANPPKVEEYLKPQKRFSHLFKTDEGKKEIELIQKLVDENILKYGLK